MLKKLKHAYQLADFYKKLYSNVIVRKEAESTLSFVIRIRNTHAVLSLIIFVSICLHSNSLSICMQTHIYGQNFRTPFSNGEILRLAVRLRYAEDEGSFRNTGPIEQDVFLLNNTRADTSTCSYGSPWLPNQLQVLRQNKGKVQTGKLLRVGRKWNSYWIM